MRGAILPVLRLARPIVAGLAASTLIGVVDTVFIAPPGTLALAGAALTGAMIVILQARARQAEAAGGAAGLAWFARRGWFAGPAAEPGLARRLARQGAPMGLVHAGEGGAWAVVGLAAAMFLAAA